jgi:AraC-like DNA-binding protein
MAYGNSLFKNDSVMTHGACWPKGMHYNLPVLIGSHAMNLSVDQYLTWIVVAAGLLSVLSVLVQRHKSDAEVLFAIFCGSISMAMLRPSLLDQPGWLLWIVTLGGCATCNMYWLFSRALFRGEGGVQRVHVAVALGIALLIMAYRVAEGMSSGNTGEWTTVLSALLTMASSSVLVLAFIEALRGWSATMSMAEKQLRIIFMLVFGTCVLVGTISGALAETMPELALVRHTISCACALLVLLFTHYALHIRRQHPLREAAAFENSKSIALNVKPEELSLASAIRHELEVRQVFREPELKVADLAERLNTAEHKVSRVITQVLLERNFNQMINRYRIAHACRLLEDANSTQSVLDISLDCGFASLGPFNRAFKAATGCTPSAYRLKKRELYPLDVSSLEPS